MRAGPSVMDGLTPAIVAHKLWWRRRWFHAVDGTRYYHAPGPRQPILAGRGFYERLDAQLRPLCRLLHAHGLQTTPSCQGHFHGRSYFEARWEELQREAAAIRSTGLRVIDAESGAQYRFRDPRYHLPWRSFEVFQARSLRHQRTGYLGVLVPVAQHPLLPRLRAGTGQDTCLHLATEDLPYKGERLLHIQVQPRDPDDGIRQWQRVTALFERALECGGARP